MPEALGKRCGFGRKSSLTSLNAGFVVLLLPWLLFPETLHRLKALPFTGGDFVGNLMWINLMLAVFNLIPALTTAPCGSNR